MISISVNPLLDWPSNAIKTITNAVRGSIMNNQNKNAYFNWFDKVNHPQPEDTALVERLEHENALLKKILMQKQQEGIETAV